VSSDVTVCIPHLPGRVRELGRAVTSVAQQTRPPEAISVATDLEGRGAWHTRNRAVETAQTEWVALLDDDDFFHPDHLAVLLEAAAQHPDADYLFTWFEVLGGVDPFGYLGRPFDPLDPHQTTTTILVRTALAQTVCWQPPEPGATVDGHRAGEDWTFLLDCLAQDATVLHVPQVTWSWVHHVTNTSGLASAGAA
jgi:hypothetical protein